MPKLSILLLFLGLITSCVKEDSNPDHLLLGRWKGDKWTFGINNLEGKADPFIVVKKQDSLFIKLLPGIDLKYKIISVQPNKLVVSDEFGQSIYTRFSLN